VTGTGYSNVIPYFAFPNPHFAYRVSRIVYRVSRRILILSPVEAHPLLLPTGLKFCWLCTILVQINQVALKMNTMLQVTRKSSTPPLPLSVSCHNTDVARPLASRASAYAGRSNFTLRGTRTRIITCTSDLRIRCEDDVYAQIREQRKAKRMAKAVCI
jgi:hypothetical protein